MIMFIIGDLNMIICILTFGQILKVDENAKNKNELGTN